MTKSEILCLHIFVKEQYYDFVAEGQHHLVVFLDSCHLCPFCCTGKVRINLLVVT